MREAAPSSPRPAGTPPCVLSIDVEDWYHILAAPQSPPVETWATLPGEIERHLPRVLDLLAEAGRQATFFFLGWIARRHPDLVRATSDAGHEIASHGQLHRLVYELTEAEFVNDAVTARKLLEDLTGQPVLGYRAAGFSVTRGTPWFWAALRRAGYAYDSSLFPASRGHGGISGATAAPHEVTTPEGRIWEFPVSVTPILGRPVCLFGGGYLRLSPYSLMAARARRLQARGQPVIFYLHPRELDPDARRLPLGPYRRFKSYVNVRGTEAKVRRLLREFSFTTFAQLLATRRSTEPAP
jgi:polysaccharide deacetylase family protein (PEP-CTERM system associated)